MYNPYQLKVWVGGLGLGGLGFLGSPYERGEKYISWNLGLSSMFWLFHPSKKGFIEPKQGSFRLQVYISVYVLKKKYIHKDLYVICITPKKWLGWNFTPINGQVIDPMLITGFLGPPCIICNFWEKNNMRMNPPWLIQDLWQHIASESVLGKEELLPNNLTSKKLF